MNRALFLDRDGVINEDRHYVHRREDFHFLDGIFDLCSAAQAAGFVLVVVTNQAGIAHGYYSEQQFHELTDWMLAQFAARGVTIARVYYCPFHVNGKDPAYTRESNRRKPAPGMLLDAARDLQLDLSRSILIGDKESDLQAAQAAGVGTAVLLGAAPGLFCLPDLRATTQWFLENCL